MSRKLLKTLSFGYIALFVLSTNAWACTCGPTPTVLDAFEHASNVIVVRMASVEKTREKQREYDIGYIRSTTMIVEKVYKGDLKSGAALKFGQGGGADCIWTFDEKSIGKQFLFYLGNPTKGPSFGDGMRSATVWGKEGGEVSEPMYYAIGCGRSTGLAGAGEDLAYLDNLAKVKGKTRISGTFDTWFDDDFSFADTKITFTGSNRSFTAKTNKDSFFELYDLPAGDYIAHVDVPFGWKIDDYMLGQIDTGFAEWDSARRRKSANQIPVRIAPGRHTSLDLRFEIDTAIKGKVLSPAGKPMEDVCVMAVSTKLAEGDHRGQSDCTNEKGEFIVDEMSPGTYRLVANYDGQIDADEPFGFIFFPGVADRAKAEIITVEAGRHVNGRVIRIPQTVELVTFKGRFQYSDGNPVVDEWVKFVPDDGKLYDDMSKKTDHSGGFEFKVPKGATGKISGDMYTYIGEFKNCPTLDQAIRDTGRSSFTAKSTVVQINSLEPSGTVTIAFSFPSCKKAKD